MKNHFLGEALSKAQSYGRKPPTATTLLKLFVCDFDTEPEGRGTKTSVLWRLKKLLSMYTEYNAEGFISRNSRLV